jgi:membrane-associated phospholipid phosphatase
VLGLGAGETVWTSFTRLRFSGFWLAALCIALLFGIGLYCRLRLAAPRLAALAQQLAVWFAFCVVLCIGSYLSASLAAPLRDADFARLDAALGFDWLAMFHWVAARPVASTALTAAYASFIPQLVGGISYFALAGEHERGSEFLWALMMSALATVAISAVLPAACACLPLGEARFAIFDYLTDLARLHGGEPAGFELSRIKGIVAFPSYHTIVAILVAYAFRGHGWMFGAALALNGLMLISVLPMGGHYLVDVLGGAAVAGAAIIAVRRRPAASPQAGVLAGDAAAYGAR